MRDERAHELDVLAWGENIQVKIHMARTWSWDKKRGGLTGWVYDKRICV